MTSSAYDEVFPLKWFMAVVGNRRLVMKSNILTPWDGSIPEDGPLFDISYSFSMYPFDRVTGLDSQEQVEFSNEKKMEMLRVLSEHFGFDMNDILKLARRR